MLVRKIILISIRRSWEADEMMEWISMKKRLKMIGIVVIFVLLMGCESSANSTKKLFVEPMIVYEGVPYKSGYDDSNLIEKLPSGFEKVGKVKGVEEDSFKVPEDGYASEQANQIRGVKEGTIIYGNKKVDGYILTEENGQYVVYSSKDKNDIDYSDFLKGVNTQGQEQMSSNSAISNVVVSKITKKQIEQYETSATQVLFHNRGKEIQQDVFRETKEKKNLLVAVSIEYIQGSVYETAYFAKQEMEYPQLLDYIEEAEDELLEVDQVVIQKGDIIKRFYWELEDNTHKDGTLALTLVFHKVQEEYFLKQKYGNTWIIQAASNLKGEVETKIALQKTRIEADYERQELTEAGRLSDREDGYYYEIEGYEDEKNGFSIQQQSSSSNQFAEWKFMKGLQAEEQLLANPAVSIVHADERLKLNIQYEIVFLRGKILFLSEEKKYETGKIEIAIPN